MKSSSEFSCDRVVSSPLCQITLFDFKVYLEARWHRPVTPALRQEAHECHTGLCYELSGLCEPCWEASSQSKTHKKTKYKAKPTQSFVVLTALPSLCLILWKDGNQQQMWHRFARRNWKDCFRRGSVKGQVWAGAQCLAQHA